MKKSLLSLFAIILFAGCASTHGLTESRNSLFQVGLYSELVNGNYDGTITIGDLKQRGDFGIGTFDGLDGEMVVLNGKVYQVPATGKVIPGNDRMTIPFAVITRFEPERSDSVKNISTFASLRSVLDLLVGDGRFFYAIKIQGLFQYMKTRSVPKQQKPYRPLDEVLKEQPIFEFGNIHGTLIGFYMPASINGSTTAGYHFHFISSDKTRGGHLLECTVQQATISIDKKDQLSVQLPKE